MEPGPEESEDICGETYDHDEVTEKNVDGSVSWYCKRCGERGHEDVKNGEAGIENP